MRQWHGARRQFSRLSVGSVRRDKSGSVRGAGRTIPEIVFSERESHVNIIIYETAILHVVLYGSEAWPLTLKEEHGLRAFGNRVLRRIFGPRRSEGTGGWRNCIMRSFVICTLREV
jgi:hypothetical protein